VSWCYCYSVSGYGKGAFYPARWFGLAAKGNHIESTMKVPVFWMICEKVQCGIGKLPLFLLVDRVLGSDEAAR